MKRFNKMTEMQMSKRIGGSVFSFASVTGILLGGVSVLGLAYDVTTTALSDKKGK